MNWRADIDTFVLKLMRKRIVETLGYLVKQRVYISRCESLEHARTMKQWGAILWLGKSKDKTESAEILPPGEFATLELNGELKGKIPVYNMRELLGDAFIEELRTASYIFKAEWVGIKHRNMTVDAQLRLWKLQGYLAQYKEVT